MSTEELIKAILDLKSAEDGEPLAYEVKVHFSDDVYTVSVAGQPDAYHLDGKDIAFVRMYTINAGLDFCLKLLRTLAQ